MNQPLVTIVIASYNYAQYLEEAIQSVLNQTYKNIELIVLDDGSTDNTVEILEKYNGQFYWESQTNMGHVKTVNKGWQMSKGEIISYLNADDMLMLTAVETSVRYLEANPNVIMAYCDFNLIDPSSRVIRKVTAPDFNYEEMIVEYVCQPGPGPFLRRSALELAGFWDNSFKLVYDFEYWLRLGLYGKFIRIPETLAGFRLHEVSQTFQKTSEEKSKEPVLAISKILDNPKLPKNISNQKNKALSNAYIVSAQLHLRAGRVRLFFLNLRQSIVLYPLNLLTIKFLRILFHALFSRIGHKILWKIKKIFNKDVG